MTPPATSAAPEARAGAVRTIAAHAGAAGAVTAGWVLAGYPASLLLARPRPARRDPTCIPRLSVLVCAHGRPDALRAKLEALAADDYPRERVQLIVAADGDPLLVQATEDAWPGATLSYSAERRGKARAMGEGLALADGDVVVLTDADNVLAPGSLRAAAAWFADPQVAAVAGRRGESGSAYDRYEDVLRRLESRSGVVAAASGEFLAVRRDALRTLPPGIVNDDLWILLDVLAAGGRVVYEPAAGGIEPPIGARAELERRARIGAGRTQLAAELRRLPPGPAWRVLNHKLGRLALPWCALAALVGLPARGGRVAHAVAAAELTVIAVGTAHALGARAPGRAGRVGAACAQVVVGLAATARGVVRHARGRQTVTWEAVR